MIGEGREGIRESNGEVSMIKIYYLYVSKFHKEFLQVIYTNLNVDTTQI
jgi:hypothetical protein